MKGNLSLFLPSSPARKETRGKGLPMSRPPPFLFLSLLIFSFLATDSRRRTSLSGACSSIVFLATDDGCFARGDRNRNGIGIARYIRFRVGDSKKKNTTVISIEVARPHERERCIDSQGFAGDAEQIKKGYDK
ncbi:hypothetical protein OPV22_034089 [Ensete ventricosum]|uniref:Uncharacterized protein n=1 Tax=Ensete ventricosum TaxID=4639 RepID=A0AAV8Q3E6_ENSVE|nr:hypothetical protein OPV22_034089 [Ensete ventricosum]